jgi:predicted dehydrogenase
MTQSASNGPIRVGIVGVGNWARHGHLRVLSVLPAYKVHNAGAFRPGALTSLW